MLTLQDCLDMCDLSPEVVEAIADHLRLPPILAAQLGCSLSCSPDGCRLIDGLLCDCIAQAARHHDLRRCARLQHALAAFRTTHPSGQSTV